MKLPRKDEEFSGRADKFVKKYCLCICTQMLHSPYKTNQGVVFKYQNATDTLSKPSKTLFNDQGLR